MKQQKNGPLAVGRLLIPSSILLLFSYSILATSYSWPEPAKLVLWLSRLDPWLILLEMRSTLTLPMWSWLVLVAVLITVYFGRVFCGWFCPLGALLNLTYYFKKFLHLRNRSGAVKRIRRRRLWLLGLFLLSVCAGTALTLLTAPFSLLSHEITRLALGQFPWLLTGIILSSLCFFPRFWCATFCPTGILFAELASFRRISPRINENCLHCGKCARECPSQGMDSKHAASSEDCLNCGRCVENCPQNAIAWQRAVSSVSNQQPSLPSRRRLFKLGTALLAGGIVGLTIRPLHLSGEARRLRPPGAIVESDFLAVCNRCSRCIKVCPTKGLRAVSISEGGIAYGTPELIPRKGACELCMMCNSVCPTGAIRPVAPLDVKIGIALLNESTCLAWSQGKDCLICKERCPANAISIDEYKRPYIDHERCIGCGACENACPVENSAVIIVPRYD